jgi:hypothetical protein
MGMRLDVRKGQASDGDGRPVVSEAPAPERDALTVARLTGAAWRGASGRGSSPANGAAARELREMAGSRDDLLAQVAGLLIGYYRQTAEEGRARAAAYLCLAAGAGPELIPRWIRVGSSRAAAARLIPPAVPRAVDADAWPEAV